MRVLVKDENDFIQVLEVTHVGYGEGIRHKKNEKVNGLVAYISEDDGIYIPHVSEVKVERICRDLMVNDYIDLTELGKCYY